LGTTIRPEETIALTLIFGFIEKFSENIEIVLAAGIKYF